MVSGNRIAVTWLAAGLLSAAGAAGQERPATGAEALHVRAVALHGEQNRLVEAARLHVRSALAREAADAEAVECLSVAAHLYVYANRPREALRTMERAAARALARGDVWRSARAYLDAAHIAQASQARDAVSRLGAKAQLLAASPMLAAEQRAWLLDRIHVSTQVIAGR